MRNRVGDRRRCAGVAAARRRAHRHARRRRAERSAFHSGAAAALRAGAPRVGLIAGQRIKRKASGFKQVQSRVANAVRGAVLRDGTPCAVGYKALPRRVPQPAIFRWPTSFLPALVKRDGFDIGYLDVIDRPRRPGVSTAAYGTGCGSAFSISPRVVADPPQETHSGNLGGVIINAGRSFAGRRSATCTTYSSATWIRESSSATWRRRCSPCASSCNGSPPTREKASCHHVLGVLDRGRLDAAGYAIYHKPGVHHGQAFGVFVYLRNLQFVIRSGGQGARRRVISLSSSPRSRARDRR